MEFVATFAGLAGAGLFVGVCAGLLGIGGGMIMIPLLRLVFGLDAYMATATSLFTIVPTSVSGAVSRIRNDTCYPKLGLALGAGGAITSALGAYASSLAPAWSIILVAALIILYSSYTMLAKALRLPRKADASEEDETARRPTARASEKEGEGVEDNPPNAIGVTRAGGEGATGTKVNAQAADGERATLAEAGKADEGEAPLAMSPRVLAKGFAIGLAAGLFAGFAGVGGGFLMVPLMISLLGLSMKKASGTSMVAMVILVIPGVIGQMLLGHVDYLAGIALAVGSIPGAMLGAKLVTYVNERQLRFLFAGFLLVAAVLLVSNEFGLIG